MKQVGVKQLNFILQEKDTPKLFDKLRDFASINKSLSNEDDSVIYIYNLLSPTLAYLLSLLPLFHPLLLFPPLFFISSIKSSSSLSTHLWLHRFCHPPSLLFQSSRSWYMASSKWLSRVARIKKKQWVKLGSMIFDLNLLFEYFSLSYSPLHLSVYNYIF